MFSNIFCNSQSEPFTNKKPIRNSGGYGRICYLDKKKFSQKT